MKLSQRGLELIKSFEGLKLEPYRCAAGVLTIGYGHTGPDVKWGRGITTDQAELLLRKDVARFEEGVRSATGSKCTQGQFDALVSFAFNLGLGNLYSSTLLKKHRAGDFKAAGDQFLRWNKARGQILPGLTRRRAAERKLYLGE